MLELILEGAQKMQKWAMDKMKEKGFATIEELEDEVDRLRGIVFDPQKIELPRPLRRVFPIKYTPDGRAIIWHEGMIKE